MSRPSALFAAPPTAWPTLAVFALAAMACLSGAWLGSAGAIPAPLAVALCTVGAYLAFTPLHEAAHRSISRSPVLNAIVGRVAGIPLMGPFVAARHFHLEHHRHTNDPHADPDHYSGRGPSWLLPLRWATQDLHYYALWLRSLSSRPRGEVIETAATFAAQALVLGALCATGHAREALLFWVLPSRIAVTFLVFAFDWLPHRPHVVTAAECRYRATHVRPGRLLEALLLGQNYHLVHHLYPGVPFYRYRAIWDERRDELVARGAAPLGG